MLSPTDAISTGMFTFLSPVGAHFIGLTETYVSNSLHLLQDRHDDRASQTLVAVITPAPLGQALQPLGCRSDC